jgi:hypothetical protein
VRRRNLTRAAAAIVVALLVALALPLAQLQTPTVRTTCCCPVPANCHCPDHEPDRSGQTQPSIRACHRSAHALYAPQLTAFEPPAPLTVAPRIALAGRVVAPPAAPHAAPPPSRPDGAS